MSIPVNQLFPAKPIQAGEPSQAKVDLHRHLEGSLRLETMLEIATAYEIGLPRAMDEIRPLVQVVDGDERSPRNLLAKFSTIRRFFKDLLVIQRIVREAIEDAANEGVRLLELRFTPAALQQGSGLPLPEVIDAVIAAGSVAADQNGVKLGLIVSVNRHEPVKLAAQVIHLACDRLGTGIVGVDLAGDEGIGDLDQFTPLFAEAKQTGLKLTIHAGEWGGPDNITHAIEVMEADRIGHGVSVMEDAGVLQLARSSSVGFETSLTSNILTGVFENITDHPLVGMIDAGLRVVITTDDPSIYSTSLTQEHQIAVHELGLSMETIKGLSMQALQLSFLEDKTKRELEAAFAQAYWG